MDQLWNNCLSLLNAEISNPGQLSVLRSLRADSPADNHLHLYAPNQRAYEQIDDSLAGNIRSCLNRVGGGSLVVSLRVDKSDSNANTAVAQGTEASFKPEFTFANFVCGSSNEVAFEICEQICEPTTHYEHLMICGGVGLGKTHLLHSVGNQIKLTQPEKSVLYLHAEYFTSQAVAAMRAGTADEFSARIRSCDCLLLDDIQFIIGKKATELMMLSILDSFLMANKKFIVVCDKYPKSARGFDPRMQSRLCSFTSAVVEPPDKQNRKKILKNKAGLLGLNLSDSALNYIAEHISSNVRELEGALKRIGSLVHFCGREPDMVTVRKALSDIVESTSRSITPEKIVQSVATYYSISASDILSGSRVKKVAHARHVCVYFCKELTRDSVNDIGSFLGGRDHTTIRHSYSKISTQIESSDGLSENIKELRNIIVN
ncbi:MAG: chromosomal replication initiator protein DnaA [Proteobacteria bacterium]|nr:chromosomal replication initiator protein DnaA [Pseudomonadota bacterium]